MNDHDLLMRIDERVGYLAKNMEVNCADIKSIKAWKNKVTGAFILISSLTGLNFVF